MSSKLFTIILFCFIIHMTNVILPYYVEGKVYDLLKNAPIYYLPKIFVIQVIMFALIKTYTNLKLNKLKIFILSFTVVNGAFFLGESIIQFILGYSSLMDGIGFVTISLIANGMVTLFFNINGDKKYSNPEIIDDFID